MLPHIFPHMVTPTVFPVDKKASRRQNGGADKCINSFDERMMLSYDLYSITRGLILTWPSVDCKKAHPCTTNTFISILFLREESSRQRYLDSYLQDNSGDMQYSASNPVRTEFHFSALHHGDYDVLWGAEL